MKTKTIAQTVTMPARPAMVYAALMNEKKHSKFTGEPALINPRIGGVFQCYGEYINGITLELARDKRIVQAWRSQGWPKGVYSVVTITLSARAGKRTRLQFTQVGVPAGDFKAKSSGWHTHYWQPLKRYLAAAT